MIIDRKRPSLDVNTALKSLIPLCSLQRFYSPSLASWSHSRAFPHNISSASEKHL